ncbi:MAG: hypothetical protein Ta2A_21220 [Treponemataceae bacterium]|nr:MAG: hypothetical protein Ta2A_21220 [Treponemataceae bacterium]
MTAPQAATHTPPTSTRLPLRGTRRGINRERHVRVLRVFATRKHRDAGCGSASVPHIRFCVLVVAARREVLAGSVFRAGCYATTIRTRGKLRSVASSQAQPAATATTRQRRMDAPPTPSRSFAKQNCGRMDAAIILRQKNSLLLGRKNLCGVCFGSGWFRGAARAAAKKSPRLRSLRQCPKTTPEND